MVASAPESKFDIRSASLSTFKDISQSSFEDPMKAS